MTTDSTVYLERPGPYRDNWHGAGWYWIDPEYLAHRYAMPARVTGPYATQELAAAEYRAYCEAMTI